MKRILIAIINILLFCANTGSAQTFELNYAYANDPFLWKVNKIEGKENNTFIYLTVRNTASDMRTIDFSNGETVNINNNSVIIRAVSNSAISGNNYQRKLFHGKELEVVLKFPSLSLLYVTDMELKIARYYTLYILMPELSLYDINQHMQTWEQFYHAHKKLTPLFKNEEDIRQAIRSEVENWQKKGEFETTAAWRSRVTDKSREEFVITATQNIVDKYEKRQEQIKQEQTRLAQSYEKYKEDLLNRYYQKKISRAINGFVSSDFVLKPYDADHETFLIHSDQYGDILLPVPVDEAPLFKQNWETIRSHIKPEYVPNGDEVALTKLIFSNNNNDYVYDNKTKANYAITDVKYNFAPIEMADINVSNIQIDGVSDIPGDITSNVVGKRSSDVLTAQNAQIKKISVTASDKSDVDTAIPHNMTDNNTTSFAVIIANEKYHSVSNVPYAEKDGEVLEKYLTRAVGLPKDHVKIYKNASFGNMAAALKHIENLSEAFGPELNVIFYYAGHGMPNEKTKSPMLLPVDGDAAIPETCYDLEKIISTLGSLDANSVVLMLDACFSGTERGDGMLMAARGIRIKSSQSEPVGNMIIMSASQGDETAYPYDNEQHGLFTYYMLKKLQDNKGDVTLGELSDYVTEQVKRQSVVSNGKLQTPNIIVSPTMQTTWRSQKFK